MAQVIFKRKTTQEIESLPIVDGQLIYDTLTGQTYMDKGLNRIKVGNKDIKANEVTFDDGETFQQKLNQGELKGEQGPQGPQGLQGERGLQGEPGTNGINGTNGKDGEPGKPGTTIYSELTDKPKINGVELVGNKTSKELKLPSETIFKELTTASFELTNNTIYKANDIASITITLPNTFGDEFISELQFTSMAPTAFTIPNTILWYGDSIKNGAFVPEKNVRYDIIFYYDGVKLRAIVQGGKNV